MDSHMRNNYRAAFQYLVEVDEDELTPDEKSSLRSLLAESDEITGLAVNTKACRWARDARTIARHVIVLGHFPISGDPGVTEEQLAWIAAQRADRLNSYQQARLAAIPGWRYADTPSR